MRRSLTCLLLALVACTAAPPSEGSPRRTTDEQARVTARVLRVIDGDTIKVSLDGIAVRVRLIGIDTPESVDPRRPIMCFGSEASAFVKNLVGEEEVSLVFDVERLDRFQRTLAYVYLRDGTFVNLELVRQGYARTLTIPPDVAHADEFRGAEREARAERRGLWGGC